MTTDEIIEKWLGHRPCEIIVEHLGELVRMAQVEALERAKEIVVKHHTKERLSVDDADRDGTYQLREQKQGATYSTHILVKAIDQLIKESKHEA